VPNSFGIIILLDRSGKFVRSDRCIKRKYIKSNKFDIISDVRGVEFYINAKISLEVLRDIGFSIS
jgi:hypothetical protein